MNIAGFRSIGSAVLLVLLAGAGCNRPKRASSESSAAPTPQGVRASITAHAPDALAELKAVAPGDILKFATNGSQTVFWYRAAPG